MTAVLRVDLDALAANLAHIRATTAPAEHMLVVKDDAYRHGLAPVVGHAWANGVRWFGAFDVRTGAAVRETVGPEARIFVWLAASDDELRTAVDLDLDVGIGDPLLLEDAARIARDRGRRVRVHLKVDTGLHRNGIRPEDWPAVVARAAELTASIDPIGAWSHLAEASDDEDDDAARVFDRAVETMDAAGLRPSVRHLAASAAAFARPTFRHDLVRVGAFAYGIRPAGGPGEAELGIRPIATLSAPVTAVGERGVTFALGALHGLPSALAGRVRVGTPAGHRRLLSVGALESVVEPCREALVGDEVVVYGEGAPSATDLAEAIGTIGEEIALRVSPLVERRYEISGRR